MLPGFSRFHRSLRQYLAASRKEPAGKARGQRPVLEALEARLAPAITITSANATTFTVYSANLFVATATGSPTPTFSETGTLPRGVIFNAATGALSGKPDATSTFGVFHLTFTASNGVDPSATQNFTLTMSGIPAFAGAIANNRYIAQVYLDLLGRVVDQPGMNVWAGKLAEGVPATEVVFDIERCGTNEFQTRAVEQIYQHFLQRAADPAGLQAGINFLNSGGSVELLSSIVIGSTEYFQDRGASTNAGFLTVLYEDALGRPIDATEEADGLEALLTGTTRQRLAYDVLRSAEYDTDLVQYFYQTFLRRPADSTGLPIFVQDLQNGIMDQQVIASILASPEYMERIVGNF